jgi:hypothetical protein
MLKTICTLSISALCAAALFHPVNAEAFTQYSGSPGSCYIGTPPAGAGLNYTLTYVNASSTQAVVQCPFSVPTGQPFNGVGIDVYAGSSSSIYAYSAFTYPNGTGQSFSGPFTASAGVSQIGINAAYFNTSDFNSFYLLLNKPVAPGNNNTFFGYYWAY